MKDEFSLKIPQGAGARQVAATLSVWMFGVFPVSGRSYR